MLKCLMIHLKSIGNDAQTTPRTKHDGVWDVAEW
jgi:hypothetical protein